MDGPARYDGRSYALTRKLPTMPESPRRTLGGNIRRIREAKRPKLSREKLGQLIEMDRNAIADLEHGRYKDTMFSTVFRVAKGLSVSLDVLVLGIDVDYDKVLMRHTPTVKGTVPHKVGVDVAPQVDARALQERTEQLEQVYRKLDDFAIELGEFARDRGLALEKNQTTKGRKSKGR